MTMRDPQNGLPVLVKRSSESRLYNFSGAKVLGAGVTIAGTPTITQAKRGNVTGSASVTVSGSTASGQVAQCRIAGGTDGEDYHMQATCTDSNGNTVVLEGMLYVRDLDP